MTARKDERIWREFQDWCRGRGLRGLPAHPWTLAAYIRWCETRHRLPTILKRLAVISGVHARHALPPPDKHPLVHRTLRMVEAKRQGRKRRKTLFREQDFLEQGSPADKPEEDRGDRRRVLGSRPKLVRKHVPANEA